MVCILTSNEGAHDGTSRDVSAIMFVLREK